MSAIVRVVGDTIQVGGETHITEDYLFSYILFPLLGLLNGLLQYLVLRRCLPRMGWWIGATVLGWLLPLGIFRLVYFLFPAAMVPSTLMNALQLALLGGLLGLCQWLVLRKKVPRAGWWILACAVGWSLAFLVAGATISTDLDVWAIALLPPLVTCLAMWALLDWLPRRD
jgi:peptidoglycan/LPS O-acetylase OafA/YrhL